jgi:Tol biopolymer transport system component
VGSNRYSVSFELADAAAHGRVLLAKDYQISGNELSALAHHISDEVYQKLTGERGISLHVLPIFWSNAVGVKRDTRWMLPM